MDESRNTGILDGFALYDEGKFADGLEVLRENLRQPRSAFRPEDLADLHFYLACCLDRFGEVGESEHHFDEAQAFAPDDYPRPLRLSHEEFDALVKRAIYSIPDRFRRYLEQVRVEVKDFPGEESSDPFILGLYVGVPRTERSEGLDGYTDTVYVYKRCHELDCLDVDDLEEEVRKTVIHEIGHHFGLDEEEMGEYA